MKIVFDEQNNNSNSSKQNQIKVRILNDAVGIFTFQILKAAEPIFLASQGVPKWLISNDCLLVTYNIGGFY